MTNLTSPDEITVVIADDHRSFGEALVWSGSPRELQILQLMADGDSPEKISEELGMSRHTLRTHTQNVLTKLGVHSKLDAIVAAIRYGKVHTNEVAPEGDLVEELEKDPA